MKNCKIISTAYNPKRPIKGGQPWPHHGQELQQPEQYKALVHKIVELENTHDAGVRYDTYIACFQDSFGLWKEWVQFDNTPTKNGVMRIIFHTNDFGGYYMFNQAFQTLRNQYDWFLFTCDDVCVFGDDHYKKILEKWSWDTGYIGLQGVTESHVQGSIGLTHRYVLERVCEANNGELPHHKGFWQQELDIAQGELPFTGKIQELGYKLVPFNDSQEWKRENFCLPYYNIHHNVQ